jgi:hypothetical protein
MHRISWLAAITAALLLTGEAALAANVSGTVTRIDARSDAITLDNGEVFTLPEDIEVESLKVGEKIEITYSGKPHHLRASQVRHIK